MNFRFPDPLTELDAFRRYGYDAEEFACRYPDISITAAPKPWNAWAASSGTAKRLKQVLGDGTKLSIDQYADELRV